MDFIDFVKELKNSEDSTKTICELAKKNNIELNVNKENEIKVDTVFVKFLSSMNVKLMTDKSDIHVVLSKDTTNIYFDSIIHYNGNNSEFYLIGDEFYIISMDTDLYEKEDEHSA